MYKDWIEEDDKYIMVKDRYSNDKFYFEKKYLDRDIIYDLIEEIHGNDLWNAVARDKIKLVNRILKRDVITIK